MGFFDAFDDPKNRQMWGAGLVDMTAGFSGRQGTAVNNLLTRRDQMERQQQLQQESTRRWEIENRRETEKHAFAMNEPAGLGATKGERDRARYMQLAQKASQVGLSPSEQMEYSMILRDLNAPRMSLDKVTGDWVKIEPEPVPGWGGPQAQQQQQQPGPQAQGKHYGMNDPLPYGVAPQEQFYAEPGDVGTQGWQEEAVSLMGNQGPSAARMGANAQGQPMITPKPPGQVNTAAMGQYAPQQQQPATGAAIRTAKGAEMLGTHMARIQTGLILADEYAAKLESGDLQVGLIPDRISEAASYATQIAEIAEGKGLPSAKGIGDFTNAIAEEYSVEEAHTYATAITNSLKPLFTDEKRQTDPDWLRLEKATVGVKGATTRRKAAKHMREVQRLSKLIYNKVLKAEGRALPGFEPYDMEEPYVPRNPPIPPGKIEDDTIAIDIIMKGLR